MVVDMDSAEKTNPATRAWCLYEWDHTLHYFNSDGLHMVVSVCKKEKSNAAVFEA